MGGVPIAGCPYWLGDSEPKDIGEITTDEGGWHLVKSPEAECVLSFRVFDGVVSSFNLSRDTAHRGAAIDLECPQFYPIEIELEASRELRWSVGAGVATEARSVEREDHVVSTLDRQYFIDGRAIRIVSKPVSTPDMHTGASYVYHCPAGYDAVVQVSVEPGFRVSPGIVRVAPPGRVQFFAQAVRGAFVEYVSEPIAAPELLAVFWRVSDGDSWSRILMHEGRAFIELSDSIRDWPVQVQFRAPDGELFCASVKSLDLVSGSVRLEFKRGGGVQPLRIAKRREAEVAKVVLAESREQVELVPADYDGVFSALQYHVDGDEIVASVLPGVDHAAVAVFYSDGSFEVHSPSGSVTADPGSTSKSVVPPHMLKGLAGNEALIVSLQIQLPEGIRWREWVGVERRRYAHGGDAADWVVKPATAAGYRVVIERMEKTNSVWRATNQTIWSLDGEQLF